MITHKIYNVEQSTAEVIIWTLQQFIVDINRKALGFDCIKEQPKSIIMQLMYARFADVIQELAEQIIPSDAQIMALASGNIRIPHAGLSEAAINFLQLSNPPFENEIVDRFKDGAIPEYTRLVTCNKQES